MLYFVYGMLGVAVITLMGIANTRLDSRAAA